ncbi:MAG: hypothetical protein BWX81_00207 [Spirochaetes bacterium ADurb.Bin110]|jgi:hypothetical protein|nr:MAG: hypothetical protein BWX81_00207 [Spirochaetes bacterium ADurb.Bin110]
MSEKEKQEPKSMGEKLISYMKGEYKFPDYEFDDLYKEEHIIYRVPVSTFKELRKKGFKNKTIAEMYGLSEMKIRKILKESNDNKKFVVHIHESTPLQYSEIRTAKRITDSYGHEINPYDIIDL